MKFENYLNDEADFLMQFLTFLVVIVHVVVEKRVLILEYQTPLLVNVGVLVSVG